MRTDRTGSSGSAGGIAIVAAPVLGNLSPLWLIGSCLRPHLYSALLASSNVTGWKDWSPDLSSCRQIVSLESSFLPRMFDSGSGNLRHDSNHGGDHRSSILILSNITDRSNMGTSIG